MAFPLLYVYGRNDLSVPFYGAKIFPSDIERLLNEQPELARRYQSFQLRASEDAQLNKWLHLTLELAAGVTEGLADETLQALFYEQLRRVNQDFREVSRLFTAQRLRIEQHGAGCGPFAGRDIRVKHKYVA